MYLLDANIYIEAKAKYYDMKVCPGFWEFLNNEFLSGNLASIQQVYKELIQPTPPIAKEGEKQKIEDDLSLWAKAHKDHFLDDEEPETQKFYVEIVNHTLELKGKDQTNAFNFIGGADPWLIAKALAFKEHGINATVVTQESFAPIGSKKVKVPNICRDFDVKYINTIELLRNLEAKFILSK